MADTTSLRRHYNAARLRSHTWDQLKRAAMDLDEGRAAPEEVKTLLEELIRIELYWAFPGRDTVRRLEEMLRSREYHGLHLAVNHPRGAPVEQRGLPQRPRRAGRSAGGAQRAAGRRG